MEEGIKLNKTLRYGYGLILGMAFTFIIDIVFSLLYTNYRLFRPPVEYVSAIFLSYLVFETLFIVNRKVEMRGVKITFQTWKVQQVKVTQVIFPFCGIKDFHQLLQQNYQMYQ